MAKVKIRWRHIFRNLGMVVGMVTALVDEWPQIREKVRDTQFYYWADLLYRAIVKRRK